MTQNRTRWACSTNLIKHEGNKNVSSWPEEKMKARWGIITFNCCFECFLVQFQNGERKSRKTFVTINQFPELKIVSRKHQKEEKSSYFLRTMSKKSFLIEYLAFFSLRYAAVLVHFAVKILLRASWKTESSFLPRCEAGKPQSYCIRTNFA